MKLSLFAVSLALGFAACSKPPAVAPRVEAPRIFEVRGILRAIDFAGQSITVEHEEIPDYMPSMTMPFDVKTMTEVEPLKAGDAIGFQLLVNDNSSWIQGVRKIDPATVRLPQRLGKPAPSSRFERLREGDRLPEFHLVDSRGPAISRETFAGKPLVLTFIFTRCPLPNFCPRMMSNLRQIEDAVASDAALAADLQLLCISFDSEYDTPEVLARYAKTHGAGSDRWRLAIGTPDETRKLTQAFSVAVQPEGGTLSHGLCTALIAPDGTIRKLWRGNAWQPAEVVAALRELKSDGAADGQ